ncbi:inner membrane protein yaah [Anaeramoeba flamelloides]|uniref:Inner membrane protein yaah n=1 Tax=Anaeramoeba flamelloides TaxID=1746091 RepID=A0ABQ8ZBH5_9EUKA|nr:inner membrane protein yaah [Anaeramoeba flamelloides]
MQKFEKIVDLSDIEMVSTKKFTKIAFPKEYNIAIVKSPTNCCEPGPLGLFSLAVGCCVLVAADLKWTNSTLILRAPWLFWVPGIAQLMAGVFEIFRKNVFGAFAFIIYGALWVGIAWGYVHIVFGDVDAHEELRHLGMICAGYVVFSVILLLSSLQLNTTFPFILSFILVALVSLTVHLFKGTSSIPAGIGLIGVGIFSFYTGAAVMLNVAAGGTVLSVGKPVFSWKDYINKKIKEKK